MTPDATRADVRDLRIHPQADLVPAMDPDADDSLVEDIVIHGIQVPLDVTAAGVVLDGRHRLRIAAALGMADVPVRVVDPDDEVGYMVRMALHRRHLDTSQRKSLAATLLRLAPHRSDRSIARETGVSHPTVAAIRERLTEAGDVEELSTRTDSLGRAQPARKAPPTDPVDVDHGTVAHDHGGASAPPETDPDEPEPDHWLDFGAARAARDERWIALQIAMDAIGRLRRTGRVPDLVEAVPVRRKASTARELRRLGTYLGSVALGLEDWRPERDDDGEAPR